MSDRLLPPRDERIREEDLARYEMSFSLLLLAVGAAGILGVGWEGRDEVIDVADEGGGVVVVVGAGFGHGADEDEDAEGDAVVEGESASLSMGLI
jgi:hypothetical protein